MKIDFPTYMRGLCNAPWDSSQCGDCGGNGLRPVMCCNGRDCGCLGMPTEFVDCDCGRTPPTDEQIRKWSEI